MIKDRFKKGKTTKHCNKMSFNILITLFLIALPTSVFSQDLVFNNGGAFNNGVYETLPLKKFNRVAWKTELEGEGGEECIIHDKIIYTTSRRYDKEAKTHKSFIYAISAENGAIVWHNSINGKVSTPNLKGSILYYGVDELEGKQFAVDKKSGKILWSIKTKYASCWPPAIIGDRNYFGSHGDRWYVVNNITGELILEKTVDGGICCRPAIVDTMLYFVDLKGILHAYNTITNDDIWTFNSSAGSNNAPAISNGIAYLINKSGELFAIDLTTGQKIWSYRTGDSMFRSPAVKENTATVITTNGFIFAFDAKNGTVKWKQEKKGLGYTNTSIVDNIVYVGCADNHLYAFNLETGRELWKFKSESKVNTPLVDNETVYFISGSYLYSIK